MWHKQALNPKALETLYEEVPTLENVELFSLSLGARRDLKIAFELPRFPDKPSPRWHKECNTVNIKLVFWDIADFEAKGWFKDMRAKIDLERTETGLKVSIQNSGIGLMISFSCSFMRIEKISAYITDEHSHC